MGRKKLENPKPDEHGRVTVVNLKGTQEFRDWLSGFSGKTHIPIATLVRLGLAEVAKQMKYPKPPEI